MTTTTESLQKPRNARLEARISSDQKHLFQRAADLTGRTLSELVIDSTQAAAARIVREHEVITLSRAEQVALVSALFAPSKPAARLKKAVQTYRRKAGA